MKNRNVIASAPNIKRLEKLLNEFFYSESYKIDNELNISNNKGTYTKVIAIKKKQRYYLYANTFI